VAGGRAACRGGAFVDLDGTPDEGGGALSRFALAAAGLLLLGCAEALAQQLEPRAYSPSPVGTNFVLLQYSYQTGSVITDPALPVQNVDAKLDTLSGGYSRTFSFLGRSASAALVLPYVWAKATGEVFEEERTVTRSGQGDMVMRLSTNILGGPALTPREFARRTPETTLGASLFVSMPTGQYDGSRLINIGTNRWAFKPELGLSHPLGTWSFEVYAGAWLYTANDDFFGGNRRTQEPLFSLQGHVSYTFLPGLWLAVDGTWYSGGQTTVNGVLNQDRLQNTRFGATLAVPLGRGHSVKATWAKGATTRFGQDFTVTGLTYQYRWF
jgi:hypothetical protein